MNRIEIMEKLTRTVEQMDDKTFATMAYLFNLIPSDDSIVAELRAEAQEATDRGKREAARSAYDRRQHLIQNASPLERRTLNQIERAKKKIHDDPSSDLGVNETDFLINISLGGPRLTYDAFRLGYERGFTAARKKAK